MGSGSRASKRVQENKNPEQEYEHTSLGDESFTLEGWGE